MAWKSAAFAQGAILSNCDGVEGQRVLKSADFLSQVTLLDDHTGEEVPVLARGPGSERVQGFVPNTRIFDWIVQAYGWTGIKR
jgi:alkaline phosphatase